MANLEFYDTHNMVAYLNKTEGSEGFHQIVDFLNTSHIRYALTENPTIYVSLIQQFWQTATASTLDNREMEITATIDGKVKIVTKASIRRHLKLEDFDGISTLPTTKIYEQLALMGSKKTAWEQFSSNIATAIIFLATYRKFNFSKLIFDGMGPMFQGEESTIPETEVPQPSSPPHTNVADEAASTGVDVRYGGAATTITGLEAGQGSGNINKIPTMPYDSPLLLRSDEGRMQYNELMDLVIKLSDRVVVLETDLTQTKKVYGAAFTKLIKKVKRLEKKDKLNKSRRKLRLVLSDEEGSYSDILALEDPSKHGRKITQIDEDEGITLVQMGVSTASTGFTTANVLITTAGVEISIASPEVKIVGDFVDDIAAESLVYIRRSAAKTKDKGKGIMEESESAMIKTKKKQEQERLGYEAALRLQEQLDVEESYTLQQLRGYSFNEIKSLFEATMKRVNTFTLMESDVDRTVPKIAAGSTKRAAKEELGQQSSKKQKSDELSQEELQQLMIIVPEEGMNIEALLIRSGYHQKGRKPSQNDKTEHGMEKTVKNQGQRPKKSKSKSIQKNQQSNRSRN
ncbi:hypothetical protein Tco_0396945 [Tanacetum coccineum]